MIRSLSGSLAAAMVDKSTGNGGRMPDWAKILLGMGLAIAAYVFIAGSGVGSWTQRLTTVERDFENMRAVDASQSAGLSALRDEVREMKLLMEQQSESLRRVVNFLLRDARPFPGEEGLEQRRGGDGGLPDLIPPLEPERREPPLHGRR
jgi:hypothetical protein